MIDDPRTFSMAALGERLKSLQQQAFAIYETAAQRADAEPAHREAYYAQAEDDVAPLLAESKRFNDERVRRLRARAARWRRAALAIAVLGGGVIAWRLLA